MRITSQISDARGCRRAPRRARRATVPRRRPDHLAAEAEAAIDRTDMDRLEQHAVGIAMHDACDRAVRGVADRIGVLLRLHVELGRIGNELARDRIARIGGIDEVHDIRRDRHRIAGGDPLSSARRSCGTSPAAIRSSGLRSVWRAVSWLFSAATRVRRRALRKCQSAAAQLCNRALRLQRGIGPLALRPLNFLLA